jgi:hypothetical protein
MNPKKPSVERIECGTITGYNKHHKALETPCRACKDAKNQKTKAYQQKNPEKVIAAKVKYRESHREELRAKGRKYYKETLEYQKERKAKYRAENKEKEQAYRKKRNQEKPEIARQTVRARRAKKKQSVSIFYTEKQVLDAVNSKLSDTAKSIWAENGQKDNNAVAKHIYNNLKTLITKNKPVAGAPGRKDMPQTDQGGAATDKLALLQKGIVNFNDPKDSDVKKESLNIDKIAEAKRLQKLAGILKG